ncbi:MAG: hypothetical protein RI513_02475 [Balneolaceae bacterium]|jgi:hypothetical protein|nr:hypothetical protein [Balneolaceae bacterium]
MFGKTRRPRSFDLPTRYYDPNEEERKKRSIKIDTSRRRKGSQGLRILTMVVLLVIVLWILI